MPHIRVETLVDAPREVCFDLARDAELHVASMAHTDERVVEGRTSGLFEQGEEVTFEGTHFGVRQQLTSRLEVVDPPSHIRDVMVKGAFKRFEHDHFFKETNGKTLMVDVLDYDAPFSVLGWMSERLILDKYLRELLETRQAAIKEAAERQVSTS